MLRFSLDGEKSGIRFQFRLARQSPERVAVKCAPTAVVIAIESKAACLRLATQRWPRLGVEPATSRFTGRCAAARTRSLSGLNKELAHNRSTSRASPKGFPLIGSLTQRLLSL